MPNLVNSLLSFSIPKGTPRSSATRPHWVLKSFQIHNENGGQGGLITSAFISSPRLLLSSIICADQEAPAWKRRIHHLFLPLHRPRFVSCEDWPVLIRAGSHFSLGITAGCHCLRSYHPYNSSMAFLVFWQMPMLSRILSAGGHRAHHRYVDTDLHTY